MNIDPWGSSSYQDYARLRDEFGIQEFTESLWRRLPEPHKLLRRGIVFGHRGFECIVDAVEHDKPWAILTGLMPSGGMHLGHKMVIDEVIYYQKLGAEIFIAVADVEAYGARGFSLEKTKELAVEEYIKNYIALGLKPERCHIYFQSQNRDVLDLAYLLGRKINWSSLVAAYGFNGSTNLSHVFSPLVQYGDILHVQLHKWGGPKPTLVPVGVDQDPHLRLSRDIASSFRLFNIKVTRDNRIGVFIKVDEEVSKLLNSAEKILRFLGFKDLERIDDYKALYVNAARPEDIPSIDEALCSVEPKFGGYGFHLPSSTYHRFMTGLTGDKMSSSKPDSAIFLTDTPKEAKKKIMSAKTGGAVTLEEHKKNGGCPEECMVYELFVYHLIDDDSELEEIYTKCRSGEQLCGHCKKHAAELMGELLERLEDGRKNADSFIQEYVSESPV